MMRSCPDSLSSFCQQVRTQQIHETKKKEKEYIKLQVSCCIFLIRYVTDIAWRYNLNCCYWMELFLFAGEAKPSIDGEEKGIITFRNGNNELVTGAVLMNIFEIFSLHLSDVLLCKQSFA